MAAGVEQGLEVAFYLYPCGLFATLLTSQAIYYYRERQGKQLPAPIAEDAKQAESIRRFYARTIWVLQFILSALLVSWLMGWGSEKPTHSLTKCTDS